MLHALHSAWDAPLFPLVHLPGTVRSAQSSSESLRHVAQRTLSLRDTTASRIRCAEFLNLPISPLITGGHEDPRGRVQVMRSLDRRWQRLVQKSRK